MKNEIDWSEWLLQKNYEAAQEELKKSDGAVLEKSAKNNALHSLFKDLAPHADSVHLYHVKEDGDGISESDDGTPHPRGLIGFNIEHSEAKRDIINKILESHGHFRDKSAFAEDMDLGDSNQQYGAIALHPHRAKNLKPGSSLESSPSSNASSSAVNEEAFSSPSEYENPSSIEGGSKHRKYQGGDPRHIDGRKLEETRAGLPRPILSPGESKVMSHRGRSDKGGHLDYQSTDRPVRGGGRKKWNA